MHHVVEHCIGKGVGCLVMEGKLLMRSSKARFRIVYLYIVDRNAKADAEGTKSKAINTVG
jgi:hypothetical protein